MPTNGSIAETPQVLCDGMDQNHDLQYENLNWSELANMQGEDYTSHFSNNNISVSSGGGAHYFNSFNCYGIPKGTNQSMNLFQVHTTEV